MKLEVLKCFEDAVENKMREVGETFDADAKRAKELLAHPMQLVKKAESSAKADAVEIADKVKDTVETADKKPVVKKAAKPAAKQD